MIAQTNKTKTKNLILELMSAKVRASVQGIIDHMFSTHSFIKSLNSENSLTNKDNTILLSFLDHNCCISKENLPSVAQSNTDSLAIDSLAISKPESSNAAILSFVYKIALMNASNPFESNRDAQLPRSILVIGHIHVSDYIKYVVHFSPALISHIVLQIDTHRRRFIDFVKSTIDGTSSLCVSGLDESSCLSMASSLMSSFSFTNKDLGDTSKISTYKIKPYGGETVEITRSLMKEMTNYWSSRLNGSFKKAYYSPNTIWIVTERNSMMISEGDSRIFEIYNIVWAIVN